MSRSPDIRVHPIDDRLAEVRGLVDELLGEWILEGDRSGPWRWVPAAKDAPESLPLADTLTAAETSIRAWLHDVKRLVPAGRYRDPDEDQARAPDDPDWEKPPPPKAFSERVRDAKGRVIAWRLPPIEDTTQ